MFKFENEVNNLIGALDKSGMLQHCIISGSWAMYFYKEIFEGFVPPIATTDFDIFLPSVNKIKSSNIKELLSDLDYVRDDDSLTGKTKYYSKDGFEIEFLTLPDRTLNNVIKIKALNIGAEALPKMRPVLWNSITVEYGGHKVNVPSPASYCLQKLLINKDRNEFKKIKDIDAIRYVLNYVAISNKYRNEFIESLNNAPKKWKKIIKTTMEENGLSI